MSKRPEVTRACFCCTTLPRKDVKALRCARCNRAYYCNKECQTKHWRYHKPYCHKDGVSPALQDDLGVAYLRHDNRMEILVAASMGMLICRTSWSPNDQGDRLAALEKLSCENFPCFVFTIPELHVNVAKHIRLLLAPNECQLVPAEDFINLSPISPSFPIKSGNFSLKIILRIFPTERRTPPIHQMIEVHVDPRAYLKQPKCGWLALLGGLLQNDLWKVQAANDIEITPMAYGTQRLRCPE
ncbi:hypothetical protein GALMADRAFT_206136 [Galerina marginata CBS 339.88]|uniref:MYND-type domain-containing protein n=1 Tax=Galerina marginata (strain CBS 339.88) TaxID=685588 RepID=A0A067TQI1_GALM3|nr:hypothetical protein GALMADRAFT_206136 [Galerina marginata CBS 339.88]